MPHSPAHGRSDRGVSLVETMIVVTVTSVIMMLVAQIFILNYSLYQQQERRSSNETSAIQVVRSVSDMTRGAWSVEASHTFDGTLMASGDTVLILKLPAVAVTGDIYGGQFDYVAFYRDTTNPGDLMIQVDAYGMSVRESGTRRLGTATTFLDFGYNAVDITKATRASIFLINEQVIHGTTLRTKAETSIFLRNTQ